MQQPIAIYVEDNDEWRHDVKEYILKFSGLDFRDFVNGSSVEEVRRGLGSATGPVVILMDLRLGGEEANYRGYHWLLEEMEEFRSKHASSLVFVISGNLHEGIQETLVRRGIPADHIYDKGSWAEQRGKFLETLAGEIRHMDEIALENITRGRAGQNIDPYLIHTLRAVEEGSGNGITEAQPGEPLLLPMVVQARDKSWDCHEVPDLQVLGRIENIFSCLGSLRTISALERDSDVLTVEASRPTEVPECATSVPFIRADIAHQKVSERGDQALVAVIDTGFDVLHGAFRDATGSRTRVIAVWDQTDPTGPPPLGQQFGTEHRQEAIDKYIEAGSVPERLKPPEGHGTHVASIAAGRATGDFAGGVAPEAGLIVVIPKLLAEPTNPTSLGYSITHLTALEYIRDTADAAGLPVVVNVSQGMNAGAHDGTSALEKGFDLITGNGRDAGIVVVKSAGNERGSGGHARFFVASGSSELLSWRATAHHSRHVVELWFKASDRLSFRLRDPNNETTRWVTWSNPKEDGFFETRNFFAIDFVRYHPDNGDSRVLVTITAGRAPSVALGAWTLEVESGPVNTSGEVHAWLERSRYRPVVFTDHLCDEYSLSIPGTSHFVICVGCVHSSKPYRLAGYSSYGPTRDGREKPDIAAPGHAIIAAVSGGLSASVAMSGTSMAAAHASGTIALLLSHWQKQSRHIQGWQPFNAAQIQAALTQSSQNYTGRWNPGMGYGVLDSWRFLQELGYLL